MRGKPITDIIFCRKCRKRLKPSQISKARSKRVEPRYCSASCAGTSCTPNLGSIQEPTSDKELLKFNKQIEQGKRRVRTDLQKLLEAQTPMLLVEGKLVEDTSPEAEIRLRNILAPNPVYLYSNTGTEYG